MKFFLTRSKTGRRASSAKQFCARLSTLDFRPESGFTLMEIAISLAIIGIALVAIIGVLPAGMRIQRENREIGTINQDATVFIEHIRDGTHKQSETDLANYIFAITNYQTPYTGNPPAPGTTTTVGYDNNYLADDSRIVGLLSTPQFTDNAGNPLPNLAFGGFSNHVVAYVRSMNGIAIEKPPQGNSTLREASFSYRVLCENLPVQSGVLPPPWSAQIYNAGDRVETNINGQATFWKALVDIDDTTNPPYAPGLSVLWARDGYTQTLLDNSRELRLTFYWPLLPNNALPNSPFHQTYRTVVGGKLQHVVDTNVTPNVDLYFFQPQLYVTNAIQAMGPLP